MAGDGRQDGADQRRRRKASDGRARSCSRGKGRASIATTAAGRVPGRRRLARRAVDVTAGRASGTGRGARLDRRARQLRRRVHARHHPSPATTTRIAASPSTPRRCSRRSGLPAGMIARGGVSIVNIRRSRRASAPSPTLRRHGEQGGGGRPASRSRSTSSARASAATRSAGNRRIARQGAHPGGGDATTPHGRGRRRRSPRVRPWASRRPRRSRTSPSTSPRTNLVHHRHDPPDRRRLVQLRSRR